MHKIPCNGNYKMGLVDFSDFYLIRVSVTDSFAFLFK